MIRFLDLQSQYARIDGEINDAISAVLREARFVGGPRIKQFEREFADYQVVAHCVGVGNGTDALELAIEALQLPMGSDVLVPALTFIASAEAVTRAGHRVVFADVDPDTYTVTAQTLAEVCTPSTKALVAVHLYGHPCNMPEITAFAAERGLRVIEDCAQAHGAESDGRRVGGWGTLGAFSFYPGKNLGAYGDAGAIVTGDEDLARYCRMAANHGRIDKYDHVFEGRSSRLDSLQAAVLSVKLRHLDEWTAQRRAVAAAYGAGLTGVGDLVLPVETSGARHVYHLYVIRTAARDELHAHLTNDGIETGIHYPAALPKLPAYNYLKQDTGSFAAARLGTTLLSLPMGEHLSDSDVGRVVESVRRFFARH